MSAVFDFIKTIVQLSRSGPPEIWLDHQIYRASGPMVHCLEMLISSPVMVEEIKVIVVERGSTVVELQ